MILNNLFLYHLLFSIIFHFVIVTQGGDPTNYWFKTYEFRFYDFETTLDLFLNGSPTGTILLFNYLPAKILGISFFVGNIMYATISFLGFVYFYFVLRTLISPIDSLKEFKVARIPIFPTLLFLPNLHFWTGGISKDSLLFFCIGLFAYGMLNIKKRILPIGIAIVISLLIRPHITLFLIVAFGAGFLIDGNLKSYQKLLISLVFLIGFVSIFNYVLQFIQLENLELETLDQYTSRKSEGLGKNSNSGIDISSYPYPLKVFTFLYRPLFFDSPNIMGILASLENLVVLVFTVLILRNRPFRWFKRSNAVIKGLVLFFFAGVATFPLILGNLGIMLRQKNMFMPMLILFGFWVIYCNNKNLFVEK
tara:strand:- start:1413 stop:2504 length:1092 start_codon:yes stop_codon:yes gene_type:complete